MHKINEIAEKIKNRIRKSKNKDKRRENMRKITKNKKLSIEQLANSFLISSINTLLDKIELEDVEEKRRFVEPLNYHLNKAVLFNKVNHYDLKQFYNELKSFYSLATKGYMYSKEISRIKLPKYRRLLRNYLSIYIEGFEEMQGHIDIAIGIMPNIINNILINELNKMDKGTIININPEDFKKLFYETNHFLNTHSIKEFFVKIREFKENITKHNNYKKLINEYLKTLKGD